ncbi:hypothetical protein F4819DRAFT_462251 [Hypoxylon fuscum]|nr:hypothetical protein F4819DRAFT_462251 [Hypoxylon fuscum]
MQTSQLGGVQLEDHLRSLILNNTDQATDHPLGTPVAPAPIESRPSEGQAVATGKRRNANQQLSLPTQAPPRAGKKRPNQAQRRQMQAQLSIPIDTRAPAPHDARPYPSPHHQYESQHAAWQNAEQNAPRHDGFPDRAAITDIGPFSQQRRHPGGSNQNQAPAWRHQQPQNFDAFSKGVNVISPDAFPSRGRRPSQPGLYNPAGQRPFAFSSEQLVNQSALLDQLCHSIIAGAEIGPSEIAEKENFRAYVEAICRNVISQHEMEVNGHPAFQPRTVQLKCFGSLASGFATKAADMDLGLLSPMSLSSPDSSDSPVPRLIEKALLEHGFGARLLTRTRVPIIKLCEKPNEKLRQDLLEARARWETGWADDGHEVVDDVVDDQDVPEGAATAIAEVENSPSSHHHRDSQQPNGATERTYEEKLATLKQSENQSLMAHYGNAKRLLRRLNGRDITISNAAGFTPTDFKLLNDVSGAFVDGLYDDSLKSRVQSCPSFRTSTTSGNPNFRSLLGVLTLVEGEKLVMLWEGQAAAEGNSKSGRGFENTVQAWKSLQIKRAFGTDPLMLNRELHIALERLRQIPLVQLIQLKQDQFESPTQYYARAAKIMADLASARSTSNTALLPQIIQHYISGIRDKQERDEVQNFASSTGVQALKAIARKHKIIHLAADYERAIEKHLYREEDLPSIKEYINILRGSFIQQVSHTSQHNLADTFDYIVPATESTMAVVEKIKQLPDPSKLAPNQPKDRYHDSLEFPKNGIGVQCDINFSAHLALQNTLLLRCYSYTDSRVRPMVLFVKHWAKARGINTPYRGTLSSYGYVLMVLHYLVNIAEPFVSPNLQHLAPPDPNLPAEALEGIATCKGRNVRFWRDEKEIEKLARQGHLNQNQESLGSLLRGFFEYYAQNNMMSTAHKRGFDWGRDVLSLRTYGGLLSKQEKGWTGAKTVMQLETGAPPNPAEAGVHATLKSPTDGLAGQQIITQTQPEPLTSPDAAPLTPMGQSAKAKEFKEVRHRFLFAIEDPFELEHNVARTVTHNGIVSIRDEFRRAWRIIRCAGKTGQTTEDLLEDVKIESEKMEKMHFAELLEEIHGSHV